MWPLCKVIWGHDVRVKSEEFWYGKPVFLGVADSNHVDMVDMDARATIFY